MNEIAAYVKDWHTYAPGETITAVMQNYTLITGGNNVGFDAISTDVYNFWSANNPSSSGYGANNWVSNAKDLVAKSPKPWMMGQAFQDMCGPYTISSQGNIVYLPGGSANWVMPSSDQIRWQALSAFATGSKGMYYFIYKWPQQANPSAPACALPSMVAIDSGSPAGLVYEDGRTTPQFEALGQAYAWLNKY